MMRFTGRRARIPRSADAIFLYPRRDSPIDWWLIWNLEIDRLLYFIFILVGSILNLIKKSR